MTPEERLERIIPIERIFDKYVKLSLPEFFERLAKSGLEIYLKKIGKSFEVGERVALFGKDGFFALGEVREFEDGKAIKPIKQFEIS
jgi:hypothetical protein